MDFLVSLTPHHCLYIYCYSFTDGGLGPSIIFTQLAVKTNHVKKLKN